MIHIKDNAVGIDAVVGSIQTALQINFSWLADIYGVCEKLTAIRNGAKYELPNVYKNANDYELLTPDDIRGNYCFFVLDDPEKIEQLAQRQQLISADLSVIFWVDLRTIPGAENHNTEFVKQQILHVLTRPNIAGGMLTVSDCYQNAVNVWRGFDIDVTKDQNLTHPFHGYRFNITIKYKTQCQL